MVQEAHRPQALGTGRKNRGCGHWWQDMGRGREGFRTIPNNVNHVLGFFRETLGGGGLRTPPGWLLPSFLGVGPGQGVIVYYSFSHSGSQAHQEGGAIPGHTGGLQGSSWVASPGQNVSLELGQSRERCRQPGSPPGTRQLWEQEDQDVQGVQPGISGRKSLLYRGSGQAGKGRGRRGGAGRGRSEKPRGHEG